MSAYGDRSGSKLEPLDLRQIESAAVVREEHCHLADYGRVHRHATVTDFVRRINCSAGGVVEVVVVDPALRREAALALCEPDELHLDRLVFDEDALNLSAIDVALALVLDLELTSLEGGEQSGVQVHLKDLRFCQN